MYTLGELLEQRAKQSAEKEALIWSTSFHTFKEYNERVNQLAHYLLSHNVKKEIELQFYVKIIIRFLPFC